MLDQRQIDVTPLLNPNGGFIYVKFDPSYVSPFRNGFKAWLKRNQSPEERTRYQYMVCDEPDIGYVRKDGQDGADDKHFWHHVARSEKLFTDALDAEQHAYTSSFFDTAGKLYDACNDVAEAVLHSVVAADPEFEILYRKYCQATLQPVPRSEHCLRAICYEANTAGKEHWDRALITVHVGDENGYLYGMVDGKPIRCQPPPGHATVFLGVKAAMLTHGKLMPLNHGSVCEPGKVRRAEAFFGHAKTRWRVDSAKEVMANPEAWYE